MESFSGGTSVSRWIATGTMTGPSRDKAVVETIRGSDFGGGVGGVLYTIEPPATAGAAEIPRFYEYGARGDVTGHSDASGTPVFRAVYKAFGDHTDTGSAGPNRQRASTKEEETTLGLLNEGYRWRDLQTGTFLSRDPAGFVDGPNLYSHVRQNPWTMFDPEGLQSKGISIFGLYIGGYYKGQSPIHWTTQDDWDARVVGSISWQNGTDRIQEAKKNPIGFVKDAHNGYTRGETDGSSGGDFGQWLAYSDAILSLGKTEQQAADSA